MASRRMFSKTITSSSGFLRMPASSRLLYYDLGMNADDDGYVEWYAVTTMTKASEQDLQVLGANGFVKIFDDKVLVILNWKENNYIQKDRYIPSKYLSIYPIVLYTECIHPVSILDTQDRIGKDRIGKVTEKEIYKEKKPLEEEMQRISEKYQVPLSFVESKWEDLENWCSSKGKIYKDYGAALRNWVKRDAIRIKQEAAHGKRNITDIT